MRAENAELRKALEEVLEKLVEQNHASDWDRNGKGYLIDNARFALNNEETE